MGKNSPSGVLKTVFKDISNIESVIKNSKKIEKCCDQVNFDDDKEVEKIIEDTKTIVSSLKAEVSKINDYFDENYKIWKSELSVSLQETAGMPNGDNGVSSTDTVSEERALEDDKLTEKTDIYEERNTEEIEKGSENGVQKESETKKIVEELKGNKSDSNKNSQVAEIIENSNEESTIARENVETPTVETENKNEDVPEQKVFLKCVDIKKLIKPDVLPQIKSPPHPTNHRDSINDSVLIISDSDQEEVVSITKKPIKKDSIINKDITQKVKEKELRKTNDKNSRPTRSTTLKMGKRHSKNKQSAKDSDATISDSNSDSKDCRSSRSKKTNRENSKSNKKVEVESFSSDSDSKSANKNKTDRNLDKNNATKKRARTKKHLLVSNVLSDSSSLSDVETSKIQKRNCQKSKEKSLKHSKKEKLVVDPQSDKKFSCKTYVPVLRIPCEKLKEFYLNRKEVDEIKRLTNLKNLKKRPRSRNASAKKDSSASSSDTENVKPKSKRKRNVAKTSEASDGDTSDDESVAASPNNQIDPEVTQPESNEEQTELDNDTVKMIMDTINSGSDTSANESDSQDGEKKKKLKKGSDDKSENSTEKAKSKNDKKEKGEKSRDGTSDEDKKKERSKWRKDKLLTSKISDSDSEDEFVKFKKRSEKAKQEVKARVCRKKAKNIIDSDSDSANSRKRKDSSGDEFRPQKKSSSSDSESEQEQDEEKEEEVEKKKRRRIKRVKDSSTDEENKSTRKTIRKVIAHDSLAETTKQAEKDEKERKARITERQKKYNQIFDSDKPEDTSVDKVVLDFNEETKEEILAVAEDLVKKLKPHQVKGVQFMWNACYESVERTKKTDGSGCILAHCMGLGKTLQVITLIHTLVTNEELTKVRRVLVVCPVNTVLNWVAEFRKWLQDLDGPEIEVFDLVANKQNYERKYQVESWTADGGVLVIGYDMFRNLTNPNNKRLRKSHRDVLHKGLVNPGPDLVVCDEGHLLKNEKSNLSIAMNRIHTIRRIVLTGTPMQNNLKEYYCMVQFVKPNLLGTYREYLNRFVNPITNGQYTDSTAHDINIMRKRSHVLHKMLDGIVQRKDYSVLTPYLPPKYEYVLFLTLSEVQIKLYRHYLEEHSRRPVDTKMRTTFLFMDFQEFQRICTHPRVLLNKSREKNKKLLLEDDEDSEGSLKDFIDDGTDEDSASSSNSGSDSNSSKSDGSIKSKEGGKDKGKPATRLTRNSAATLGIDVVQETEDAIDSTEWWSQFCSGDELDNIALSSKLYLLFEILQQCELIGDKLLVFSQSLYSLSIIEYFLGKIDEATQKGENEKVCGFSGSWALGLDYFRLDGSSSCDNRTASCTSFNSPDNPQARLFLISTKAGGLGINLVGANRVVIFDVSWNPSHDIQSIYRIYRFGQTKPCYIYRFVTNGAMEMKIYERQVTKQAISKRVIDEQQIDRHYNQTDLAELYNFDPKPEDQPTPLLPKDVLLAEILQKEKDRVFSYHEHQSLLENKEDEELDEAERKAAWDEYENEKTARVAASSGMGWIKNLPISSITAAVVNIVQKDNPAWTREQVQSVVPLIVQQLREQVDKGEMLLFNRIVNELKLMQANQQKKLQEYYMQQQIQMLQQRYVQQQRNVLQPGNAQQRGGRTGMGFDFNNALRTALTNQSAPTQSNEIVELND